MAQRNNSIALWGPERGANEIEGEKYNLSKQLKITRSDRNHFDNIGALKRYFDKSKINIKKHILSHIILGVRCEL